VIDSSGLLILANDRLLEMKRTLSEFDWLVGFNVVPVISDGPIKGAARDKGVSAFAVDGLDDVFLISHYKEYSSSSMYRHT
jgi:hypothetical protein